MDGYERERNGLLAQIAAVAAETARATGLRAFDARVMAAMATVPRHEFVLPADRPFAWSNRPLPIRFSQTISQPFIVALMTQLLALDPEDHVLEVGTGCGYQTAVLATLARHVYSIELEPELAASAAARLERLGYHNVDIRTGDGAMGWPETSPFDAVIVTACAREVPPALVAQLRPGGRLVLPLTTPTGQELMLIEKGRDDGDLETKPNDLPLTVRSVLRVAFVPLREQREDDALLN